MFFEELLQCWNSNSRYVIKSALQLMDSTSCAADFCSSPELCCSALCSTQHPKCCLQVSIKDLNPLVSHFAYPASMLVLCRIHSLTSDTNHPFHTGMHQDLTSKERAVMPDQDNTTLLAVGQSIESCFTGGMYLSLRCDALQHGVQKSPGLFGCRPASNKPHCIIEHLW